MRSLFLFRKMRGTNSPLETALHELQEAEMCLLSASSRHEVAQSNVELSNQRMLRLGNYVAEKTAEDGMPAAAAQFYATPTSVAAADLGRAKLAALSSLSQAEEAFSVVTYNRVRIARLRTFIKAESTKNEQA